VALGGRFRGPTAETTGVVLPYVGILYMRAATASAEAHSSRRAAGKEIAGGGQSARCRLTASAHAWVTPLLNGRLRFTESLQCKVTSIFLHSLLYIPTYSSYLITPSHPSQARTQDQRITTRISIVENDDGTTTRVPTRVRWLVHLVP